jgi:hypothetical protein
MAERPILFSAPMVRAILDGKKTQTRRVVKAPKCATVHGRSPRWESARNKRGDSGDYLHLPYGGGDFAGEELSARVFCPYGDRGDLLWVREAFCYFGAGDSHVAYRATDDVDVCPDAMNEGGWKPSIHMPRRLSRLTLRITDVRAQQLARISEQDCEAELGFEWGDLGNHAYGDFMKLWDKINGKRPGCSWDANPWVWAVSFEVVKGEANADAA